MSIEVASGLIVGTSDTPLDARSRIPSLAAVADVENPFVGMIFYSLGESGHYKVVKLKAKQIGALSVENAAIDEYEPLIAPPLVVSPYIYFDVPHGLDADVFKLEIEFSNDDSFALTTAKSHTDCMVFNPPTGHWITPPEEGLGVAFFESLCRMLRPDFKFGRYRYQNQNLVFGVYKNVIM